MNIHIHEHTHTHAHARARTHTDSADLYPADAAASWSSSRRFLILSTTTCSSLSIRSRHTNRSFTSSNTIICLHISTNIDTSPLYARCSFIIARFKHFRGAHATASSSLVPSTSFQRTNCEGEEATVGKRPALACAHCLILLFSRRLAPLAWAKSCVCMNGLHQCVCACVHILMHDEIKGAKSCILPSMCLYLCVCVCAYFSARMR
jgi:hypothetical protein